jgi:hypothetical protein
MTDKYAERTATQSELHNRIAKVLNRHKTDDQYDEWADCQCGHVGQRWDDHVADAVIAELGLIRDPFSTVAFCRYVTQWQPNERFAPYCNRCGIPHGTPCKRPAGD